MKYFLMLQMLFTFCIVNAQLKVDDVKTFTLKNGMKFIVVEDNSIPNANMYLFYKVGSRNEYQGITGLSHFFEHMMFNGAKKYGPKMFDRTMEFNGGSNNAYTTNDVTVYTNWFPSSSTEVMFDLEADRISSLTIAPSMIESERGVVMSERSTGLENSPWELLFQSLSYSAFQEHPYHWPVIGFLDDIKNWNQQDLELYFKTYYAPNNCTVVMSGNITVAQVKNLAQKYFENIPAQPTPKTIKIVEPEQLGERRVLVKKDVSTPYIGIGYHTPSSSHQDYYALSILSSILSAGNSSRLYSALVDKAQIATEIFSNQDRSFDPSLFTIGAVCSDTSNDSKVEQAIYTEIEKVKTIGITDKELQKVKNEKLIEFYNQIETIDGKSNNLGTYELFFGDYSKMFQAPEKFNAVTKDDVKRVAIKYFTKQNRTVAIAKADVNK
jgi:zinc protease